MTALDTQFHIQQSRKRISEAAASAFCGQRTGRLFILPELASTTPPSNFERLVAYLAKREARRVA